MSASFAIRALLTAGLMASAAFPAFGVTRLEINGIKGSLLENARTYVGLPVDDNPLVVRRHAEGAAGRANSALEALGYYDADIRVSTRQDEDDRILQLDVEPGKPVRVASVNIHIEGEAADNPDFIQLVDDFPLKQGDILDQGKYENAKRSLENLALAQGYFDAAFTTNEILIRIEAHEADIVLLYDSGKRYRFGPVHFSPTPFTDLLLERLVPFKEGDPFSSDQTSQLHLNLLNCGYFKEVRVLPKPDETGDSHQVPIEADLKASLRNKINFGIGATTDVGPRFRLGWDRPWINRYGHFTSFNTILSVVQQEATAQYTIPLNPPLTHQLQWSAGWEREDVEDTDRETISTGIEHWRVFPSRWEQSLFLRWEYEQFIQADVVDRTQLLLPGISLSRTRRSSEVNPTHGDRLFGLVEGASSDFFSDISLVRGLLQAKRLDTWGNHRLSGRIEYGAMSTEDFDRTPPSLRFFAGGDQSVRGFGYQSLSPTNDTGELIGGSYLLTGSLEYQYQFAASWRAALFFDAGNAFTDSSLSGGFAQGTGFGIHWVSPLAPIKLDFAWGISESPPPFRVHLSMGFEI